MQKINQIIQSGDLPTDQMSSIDLKMQIKGQFTNSIQRPIGLEMLFRRITFKGLCHYISRHSNRGKLVSIIKHI